MQAGEVIEHYETVRASEQTWLDENQDLLGFYHAYADLGQKTSYNGTNGSFSYEHKLSLRFPLPSHAILEALLTASRRYDVREIVGDKLNAHLQATLRQAVPIQAQPQHTLKWQHTAQLTCTNAEPRFAYGVSQVIDTLTPERDPTKHPDYQPLMSVYHTADGTPLLLRKQDESSTALLLDSVTVFDESAGSLIVPRGTIVSAIGSGASGRYAKTGEGIIDDHTEVRTYEINPENFGITPLRLSPWAFDDVLDRKLFAVDYDKPDWTLPQLKTANWEEFGTVTPAHVSEAANRIMEICGVATAQPVPGSELAAS